MKRIIVALFSFLFFAAPLVFFSKTSELFEFNKIVLLYAITLLVCSFWAALCIQRKKIIFKRSLLDIPLIIFVGSQIISTLLSIDTRTSIFGYYSRFNGGLLSVLSYALLYWAFVTFVERKNLKRLFINILLSTLIASIWGTLEHFGKSPSCFLITGTFDVNCWVQDVALRVYATFGQPNWMAAWLAAILPLTMCLAFISKTLKLPKNRQILLSAALTSILLAALIFTKSKSGLMGFVAADILFSGAVLYFHRTSLKKVITPLLVIHLSIALVSAIFGTQWSPSIGQFIESKTNTVKVEAKPEVQNGTSLETGGTDSGEIRKIVWEGAVNVWQQFPIFGSGVETFAFSYYRGRPMRHNTVSEWNFLYNKAHNEYLNYLATTGLVGVTSYLVLIGSTIYLIYKTNNLNEDKDSYSNEDFKLIKVGVLAGYISILITNFFGFSVVPISLLFFLSPAVIVALNNTKIDTEADNKPLNSSQIIGYTTTAILSITIFMFLINYWRADYFYAKGIELQNSSEYSESIDAFRSAISLSPNEALYHSQLGSLYADLTSSKENDKTLNETFVKASKNELEIASKLSPQNIRVLKSVSNSYAMLGDEDSSYFDKTLETIQVLQELAPTDPSIIYQACLTLAKQNRVNDSISLCEEALKMKPNYKIVRRLLAFLYEHTKQTDKAKEQLNYILKYISPDDIDVQKELQGL